MGPSPGALWEVEGASFNLQNVKIPQKSTKNVVHWNRSLPHGEVHREKNIHTEICCTGTFGIVIVFIGLIYGLSQGGRSLLGVCMTQSCLELIVARTVGSPSSASRHFRGKTRHRKTCVP